MSNADEERHAMKMAKKKAARDKIMATKTDKKGLIIVNTGKGKGKSSAAFGMIFRCIGGVPGGGHIPLPGRVAKARTKQLRPGSVTTLGVASLRTVQPQGGNVSPLGTNHGGRGAVAPLPVNGGDAT